MALLWFKLKLQSTCIYYICEAIRCHHTQLALVRTQAHACAWLCMDLPCSQRLVLLVLVGPPHDEWRLSRLRTQRVYRAIIAEAACTHDHVLCCRLVLEADSIQQLLGLDVIDIAIWIFARCDHSRHISTYVNTRHCLCRSLRQFDRLADRCVLIVFNGKETHYAVISTGH